MDFEAQIRATLDTSQAKSALESFKASIKNETIKIKLDVDENYLKNQISGLKVPGLLKIDVDKSYIQNQINSSISGIKFQLNPNSYQNSARQTGQNIGNIISDSAEKSIERLTSTGINKYFKVSTSGSNQFSKEMEKLVSEWTNGKGKLTDIKINTRTSFDTDEEKNIERLDNAIVKYTNDIGESIQKRIAWRQIGVTQNSKGEDVPLRGFVEVSAQYSKSIDEASAKTDNFVNKQKQAVANLKNTLNQISSNALDRNASKAIMNDSKRAAITDQVDEVNRAISVLENSNATTFTDAKIGVEEQISALKILIKEMQNAETTATALRSKPIDVVIDETSQKIKGLKADIKKAGVSSDELEGYKIDMDNALANPNIDASGINNVLNIYAKAKAELSKLKKEVSADSSIEKAKIKADSLTSEINKTVSDNLGLSGWETEINGVKTSVASLISDLQQVQTTGDVSLVSEKWKAFSNSAKQAGVIAGDVLNDIEKIDKAISTKSYDAKISSLESKLKSYSGDSDEYKTVANSLEEVKTAYESVKTAKDAYKSDKSTDNYNSLIKANDNLVTSIKRTENEMKILGNKQSTILSSDTIASTKKSFTSYLEGNSKAVKAYKFEIAELEKQLESMSTVADKAAFDTSFNNLQAKAISEGNTGKSFFHELGQSIKHIAMFANVYGTIQRIPEVLNQMYQEVVKVDSAMTNLYKVTDETSATYNKFLSNAGSTAKELGRDISSYITQTSEWAKLGYSLNSSKELAKVSSIYSNTGEVDDKTAVSDLVTVMKAYNMQDSQAMNIADMLNELGNRYATSASDLGAGLTRMASTMAMSNVSLEKSLAILTGGTEITQDAEELGNAIKVSVLRMRGQKGKLEELGENADDIESVSKMQTQILNMTKGAVNIMDSADPTKFRDYYDVMADIAEVLPKLKETDQADLIETLFGKNRANQGQAILQAFQSGKIQEAYKTALTSEGSAMKEQERWLDSIEAKTQQFKAAFQELSTVTLNSNFIKKIIDGGTGLLGILTQIIDTLGLLPPLIAAIGGGKLIKNLDCQKVLRTLPRVLSRSNIDKEMIKWFIVQIYAFGSSKINQRGVIAGTDAHEYSTKAEFVRIYVKVRKAEKTEYSTYGNLCENMRCA